MFSLEWLQKQEGNSSFHWYKTGCICDNCKEVRSGTTVPYTQDTKNKRKPRLRD